MTTVQKKGEELIEYCRSQGNIPVSLEQSLSNFTDRWNSVGSLIDDRRHKALLARRRREVQDLMITLEAVIKDVERVIHKFSAEVPDNEYEMKSQLELCKVSDSESSDDTLEWFLQQAQSKEFHALDVSALQYILAEKVTPLI